MATPIRICDHTFLRDKLGSRPIVVDLGMNRGEFSKTMLDFGGMIFGVEPVSELFDQLPEHPRLKKKRVAVGPEIGDLMINIYTDRCSSIIGDASSKREIVHCVTLEQLLSEFCLDKVDLLKVDIEGAELGMFKTTPDHILQKIQQISVEFHKFIWPEQEMEIERTIVKLERAGFEFIDFTLNRTDVLFINRKIRCSIFEKIWLSIYKYVNGFARFIQRR